MRAIKICYKEEDDRDFIRWTSNLMRTFLNEGIVQIVRQDERPDMMLDSIWRKHALPLRTPVVLITNESWKLFRPHRRLSDYKAVVGLYPPDEPCTFIQFPFAAVHFDVPVEFLYKLRNEFLAGQKSHFCCFLSTNQSMGALAAKRVDLFHRLSEWQRVDSGGRALNNLDYVVPRGPDSLRWISQYRFMICLENSREPHYITEKPFQPWFAGTVPIYDGGCVNEVNQDAIVNASTDDVFEQLKLLEANPDAYEAKRRAPLTETPLSLTSFEEQFRKLVLETL